MATREPDWSVVERLIAAPAHARSLLSEYFRDVDWSGEVGYTGSWFERFDGGGDRHGVANRFTAADMTAVTMLGVEVPARVAWQLVSDETGRFGQLLACIPTDLDLVAAPDTSTCLELWDSIRPLHDVGRTITSKLLARKRPRLVPIQDAVTMRALGDPTVFWEPLHRRLQDGLHGQLVELAAAVHGVPAGTSALRILDVLLWMEHH
ncbi:DUF6308 family protein [Dactylosporangium sp. NPDC050588]|uniref:DUF6308 family protein n=1 Tax=Dactylosporangium sp. NPDC050588 TaxID=3157211 RepID=UPI0033E03169